MGMPEYHDGSFGPIKPIEESVKDLLEQRSELERTKALHVGKFADLLQRAGKSDVPDERLAKLESQVEQMRLDVNKIMIHLGIDDKTQVLPVKELPKGS